MFIFLFSATLRLCVFVTMFCLGDRNACSENSTKQNGREGQRWQIYREVSGKMLEKNWSICLEFKEKCVDLLRSPWTQV